MKNILIVGFVVLALLGGMWWSQTLEKTANDTVTTNGLHSHPELEIYVKGEKIDIPQNLGLGAVHSPIHTHDDVPIIHLEFSGVVTERDMKLAEFFKVWGKDINSFGSDIQMTVNGENNTEFGNYVMKNGDKIVLRYE
ncbi:hypothetical protein EPO56_00375 [Patescibacteria group bacterium]|nr:MAG: hypothetical protein EPO56_00375 [Patescibacteria group bacterium]